MSTKTVEKDIGCHKSTIIALYLNFVKESEIEIVTLDEDGIIKIHKDSTPPIIIDLSKYSRIHIMK